MYDYENSPEPELIRRAKRGDIKAFSQLYARIYQDLYKFALYMTRHTQDAEDAVSDTVLSAYENISSLRKEDSFRNWMFTILSNRCKRMQRSGQKEIPRQDGAPAAGGRQEGHEPDYAQWHDVRRACFCAFLLIFPSAFHRARGGLCRGDLRGQASFPSF